ncbi:hypothetical protein LCGC14_2910020 [marine sediment metagenome]|uniref:Holliday junction resolvase n=1 Tax=marine sediment metagenome TaxID=412755 RepID=A0A0F8XS84_9ZZZZ
MSRLSEAARGESRIGKAGRKAEKRTLKSYGAAAVPNSGAANAKGDGTLPGLLMEIKSTQRESLTLKREMLHKIAGEAAAEGVEPCLAIVFTDGGGEPRRGGSWVCIPRDLFEELTDDD